MLSVCSPSAHKVFTPRPVNHMYNDKKRVTVRQTVTPKATKNQNSKATGPAPLGTPLMVRQVSFDL